MHKSLYLEKTPSAETLLQLKEFGLSSVFLDYKQLSKDVVTNIKASLGDSLEVYACVTVFAGKDLLMQFPDAALVEATGKEAEIDDRVCPNHQGVRAEILERVKLVLGYGVDGLWLNGLKYSTKWALPEPVIYDVCYCERCLAKFSAALGDDIVGVTLQDKVLLIDGSYYLEWLEFKCNTITSMAQEIKEVLQKSGQKVKYGFFAVPWKDKEYSAGIKRVLGQDFGALAEIFDIFSPQLFHGMCGRPVDWVKEMEDYFWEVGKPMLPLIQTENKPDVISNDEFEKAVRYAAEKPSMGVCVFYWEPLTLQPEKLEVAKTVLNTL